MIVTVLPKGAWIFFSGWESIVKMNTNVKILKKASSVLHNLLLLCFGYLPGSKEKTVQMRVSQFTIQKFSPYKWIIWEWKPFAIVITSFAYASLSFFGTHPVGIVQDLFEFRKWGPHRPPRMLPAMPAEVIPRLPVVRFQWQKVTVTAEEAKYTICERLK